MLKNKRLSVEGDTYSEIGARFPHAIVDGKYNEMHTCFWTSGFWPGILWLAHQETKDKKFSAIAQEIEKKLDIVLDEFDDVDHDAGHDEIYLLSCHNRFWGYEIRDNLQECIDKVKSWVENH